MEYFDFYNGVKMPALGLGIYQIEKQDTKRVVTDALEVGYRMFDTASVYFNEAELGEAITESGVERKDLFITSKLWVQDYETDDALKAFDRTLKLLKTDYLDLYLLHKPYGNYYAAWRVLERLYREGRVRAIGITSFTSERVQDLMLHNEIRPMLNQLETNPFFHQKPAHLFLAQHNIVHQAWAPFAEGECGLFSNPMLVDIARNHGKSVAQVVLRWHLQRHVAVIPKTTHRERMAENLDVFSFSLSAAEIQAIDAMELGHSAIFDDADLANAKELSSLKTH